jgi:plasmid stabilization system protein ParE
MPAELPVRYLPAAQEDLLSILDFIAQDSLGRASAFVDELDRRIDRLGRHPQLGRVPRNATLRSAEYRILVVESYLVFYRNRQNVIEIHRVVHGSRDLDHLL